MYFSNVKYICAHEGSMSLEDATKIIVHGVLWYITFAHNVPPDDQWFMLVFSDQRRFNLNYNNGCARVWRTQDERFLLECLSQTQKNTTHP